MATPTPASPPSGPVNRAARSPQLGGCRCGRSCPVRHVPPAIVQCTSSQMTSPRAGPGPGRVPGARVLGGLAFRRQFPREPVVLGKQVAVASLGNEGVEVRGRSHDPTAASCTTKLHAAVPHAARPARVRAPTFSTVRPSNWALLGGAAPRAGLDSPHLPLPLGWGCRAHKALPIFRCPSDPQPVVFSLCFHGDSHPHSVLCIPQFTCC